ncbi:MAG: NAD-dependent epimerase/dehydratase family protein [Streptosporangiaceae bacterium]
MARVVLITGVSGHLGGRLAEVLQAEPGVERVIGVDVVPPRPRLGRTEFVRVDIRTSAIGKVIEAGGVDTVVHASLTAPPGSAGGRASMKETNVVGTMQLLAACQRAPSMRRFVLRSTTAVYGSSPRDPALFTEDMEPLSPPRSGYAKDAVEVESYVRGFARRRSDAAVTILRFAGVLGADTDSPLARYFSFPVLPTVLGFDPRLQFLHEDDAVDALRRTALANRPGTFNVSGDGVVTLSQAARRVGRPMLPIPVPTIQLVGRAVRRAGLADFSPEQLALLSYGRTVDTSRLRSTLTWSPAYTTVEAFDDFVRRRGLGRVVPADVADRVVELFRG